MKMKRVSSSEKQQYILETVTADIWKGLGAGQNLGSF